MTDRPKEIKACNVCGSEKLVPVLDLGLHPLCDDLIPVGDERTCREYPIDILLCPTCVTAHQRFQLPQREVFPPTYHYRSRFTADVLSGMAHLVASSERSFGPLKGKTVLDIGCNDGSLLDLFRDRGAQTLGVEPTNAYRDAQEKGHVIFNEYLSGDVASEIVSRAGKPDFITFTNVFAHISEFEDVIRSLQRLMSPRSILVIENHYLGSVLDGNQFDTFYQEHARTYSLTSFVHIARSLDVQLIKVEFPARYGGNVRVFLGARPGVGSTPELDELTKAEAGCIDRFREMRSNIARWQQTKHRRLEELLAKSGSLRAKAFPGRAAILVRLLEIDERTISAVYEKPGSLKIGHYVPGTRIPIRSDDELFAHQDRFRPILNLAWHIPSEIRTYLMDHGYRGPVIDIVSPEDFN